METRAGGVRILKIKEYLIYTTSEGDTWDLIALKFLHEERKATLIMDENPFLRKTIVFDAGVKIMIPVFEENLSKESLAPWRR